MNCRFTTDGKRANGLYQLTCVWCEFTLSTKHPPDRFHRRCDNPPELAPFLTRLAKLTNHPEIIDQPEVYGRAVLQWAAGVVHHTPDGRAVRQTEPGEIRDDGEVQECLALCREVDKDGKSICGKHREGVCRPSCGVSSMIVAVKARMASEACPHRSRRW